MILYYLFMYFINAVIQVFIGGYTGKWECSIFFIISLGFLMLGAILYEINKSIKSQTK